MASRGDDSPQAQCRSSQLTQGGQQEKQGVGLLGVWRPLAHLTDGEEAEVRPETQGGKGERDRDRGKGQRG